MPARKPPALKLLANTARPDRVAPDGPGLPLIDGAPTPPLWMTNLEAAKEFQRLAPILAANRLLTEGNAPLLSQYCALHGRLIEMWTAGTTPTAALLNAYRAFAGALGLTSMRLPAVATGKPNRFANNVAAKRL